MFQTRVAPTSVVPFISIAAGLALLGSPSAAGTLPGDVLASGGSPAISAARHATICDDRVVLAATTGCQPIWTPALGMLGADGSVNAFAVVDDGSGPALYVGGTFASVDGVAAKGIAKWDGTSCSALGSGIEFPGVFALTQFDAGSGPTLYAGGKFSVAGGVPVKNIARWDGTNWSSLGGGLVGTPGVVPSVEALTVFDDGTGAALYVGGQFMFAGGVAARGIAKWDGTSWSPVGSAFDGIVTALTVFDDGSGPALYAGGYLTIAGVPGEGLAKWDGTSWSALGSGTVYAFEVFDDGSGPALYIAGDFGSAGGVSAKNIAKWDGSTWSALGSGTNGLVSALTVFDDGTGPALCAGGFFTTAGGVAANRIAKWDGASWSGLGFGMDSQVHALAMFDEGIGPALYAGGAFASAGGAAVAYAAKWGCPAISSLPGCSGNPATLEALAYGAPLGTPLALRITGSLTFSGSSLAGRAQIFYGSPGIDAGGCGLQMPGLGELLLAPAPSPLHLASGAVTGGFCDLSLFVPSMPALSGVTVHLQGALADFSLPQPVELTNALAVKLGP